MLGLDFAQIMGIVRTIAASLGGSAFVASYFESQDAWMAFVGAGIVVVTAIFSIVSKRKVASEVAALKDAAK